MTIFTKVTHGIQKHFGSASTIVNNSATASAIGSVNNSVSNSAEISDSETSEEESDSETEEEDYAKPSEEANFLENLLNTTTICSGLNLKKLNLDEIIKQKSKKQIKPNQTKWEEHSEEEEEDDEEEEEAEEESESFSESDEETYIDIPEEQLQNLTPLQSSVVKNLDPHHVKQGVITKLKDMKLKQDSEQRKNLRLKIASKLEKVFNLKEDDVFYGNYSAWLVKDVLLQGHLYLTKNALLYFSFLPKDVDEIELNKGALGMKTAKFGDSLFTTMITHRYWAILRPEGLSIYSSSTDLYFPLIVIDMRTCINADLIEKKEKMRSGILSPIEDLTEYFDDDFEDTVDSSTVWFKLVTKKKTYKFQCDNLFSARQWCNALTKLIFQLNNAKNNEVLIKIPIENVIDYKKREIFHEEGGDIPLSLSVKYHTGESKRDKVKDKFRDNEIYFLFPKYGLEFFDQFDEVIKQGSSGGQVITTLTPSMNNLVKTVLEFNKSSDELSLPKALSAKGLKSLNITFETSLKEGETNRYDEEATPLPVSPPNHKKGLNISQKLSAAPNHYVHEDKFFIQDSNEREIAQLHFEEHFSVASKLYASYYCHLIRTIPVYGKLYLSENEICFRSLIPGVSTKMNLPMQDVLGLNEAGSKLTYSGVKIILQNDELVLEFSSSKSKEDFFQLGLELLENFHKDEIFRPKPHEWGSNYDIELAKTRMEYTDSERKQMELTEENFKISQDKIELARIKMFEDRLTTASGLDVPIILEDSPFFKTELKPSTSFNITLLTIGSRGDVQPYIALGKGLIEEGHNVTIATHSEFKDWIEKYNIKFAEIAGDPGELMSFMVTHNSMSVSFLKDAQSMFKDWIDKLFETTWKACQGCDILIESPSAMAGIHIAEALAIPYLRAFTMPWTRTRAYPHAFFVPDQKKGGSYNYLTHVLFENILWKGISSQVNKWREEIGLPKTNLFRLQQSKVPFLYNVSPSILPPAVDFPDFVKVTGYWFLNEESEYKNDELQEFMDNAVRDGKKLVYIGFGSIVVSDATSLTKAVIDSVLDSDVRCILNKGWSDRKNKSEEDIEFPPEIFNVDSVPHDWLFPRIDAAVHHGGSGTTGAALKAGCPSIIKPFFGDQFFYATRIEDLSAGIALKKLTKKSLSKALQRVTDLKIVEKVKNISQQISQEHGVFAAIEAIYSELEYARNLILIKDVHNKNVAKYMSE
ncbi:unnamed protein product [Candida verbasci]|uniref:Sterol 3-beta-glucosyltransferase n=1 Tax=Candida verbasci TaxID=1227364 RepID=A0A9W4TRL9_9ASCO|nr:unnamed protein product [Candida verbasci]